jgi:ABC-2 type transport system ATP-binding protein
MSLILLTPNSSMPPQAPILRVEHLTKHFLSGPFFVRTRVQTLAIRDISFEIQAGEIVGMLGPNGAGKTTTMHMLIGALKPTSGSIFYFNRDFSQHRSELLEKIAFASGSIQLPTTLSVIQNLDIYARLYGLSSRERSARLESLLTTFGIWHLKDLSSGHLSYGQMARLMIVKAFLAHPKIVFLDEATAALDPEIALTARDFLMNEKKMHGTAILFASHNMDEVAHLCDRVLIMKEGIIVANKSADQLTKEVTTVKVQFTATRDLKKMDQFLTGHELLHTIDNDNITVELDEHAVAQLLSRFAQEEIMYSHISIEKPNLEDYFFKMTAPTKTIKEL